MDTGNSPTASTVHVMCRYACMYVHFLYGSVCLWTKWNLMTAGYLIPAVDEDTQEGCEHAQARTYVHTYSETCCSQEPCYSGLCTQVPRRWNLNQTASGHCRTVVLLHTSAFTFTGFNNLCLPSMHTHTPLTTQFHIIHLTKDRLNWPSI